MDTQPLPLPPEFRQALDASGGLPLYFEDPDTHERFILQQESVEITLDEEYIAKCLDEGLADIEAGRIGPWDIEATIAKAKQRFAEKHP
jgi:hypothetical protein